MKNLIVKKMLFLCFMANVTQTINFRKIGKIVGGVSGTFFGVDFLRSDNWMRDNVRKLVNNKKKTLEEKIAKNNYKEPLEEKLTTVHEKLNDMKVGGYDSFFNFFLDPCMPCYLHRRIYLHWLDKRVGYYEWIQKVYYDEKK